MHKCLLQYKKIPVLSKVSSLFSTGGRIYSHETEDGTILELGAHYIHGTPGNPVYDFAFEKGLIKDFKDERGIKSFCKNFIYIVFSYGKLQIWLQILIG